MGQQQLLLIVLGIIIVGLAVVFAINMFRQGAVDSKRDLLMNEGVSLANMAINYYKKPKMLGGGGNSFEGWIIPQEMTKTATGSFVSSVSTGKVIITGTGNEIVTGNDSVKVQVTAMPDTIISTVIN